MLKFMCLVLFATILLVEAKRVPRDCPPEPPGLIDPCFSPCNPASANRCPSGEKCCPVTGCHICLPLSKPGQTLPAKQCPLTFGVDCLQDPCKATPNPCPDPAKSQCCADYSVGCNYTCI